MAKETPPVSSTFFMMVTMCQFLAFTPEMEVFIFWVLPSTEPLNVRASVELSPLTRKSPNVAAVAGLAAGVGEFVLQRGTGRQFDCRTAVPGH